MAMQLFYAAFTVLVGVGGCLAYFWGSNALLDVLLPVNASNDDRSIRNLKLQSTIRPWLFLFPAMILLTIYLIYPVFQTIWLSFHDKAGDSFVGLDNYRWAFNDTGFRTSIFNNFLWLLVVPAACTFLGLVIAVLTDRIFWGPIAKSFVFLPMAISFVGASVIWKFVYDYRGEGQEQIRHPQRHRGMVRRLAAGMDLHAFLEQLLPDGDPDLDPDRLCHRHPRAALRGVPEDTLEARGH